MKKLSAKALSMLLILVMIFASLPLSANAKTDNKTDYRYYGMTGDVPVDDSNLPDDITIISSVADYNKLFSSDGKVELAQTSADALPTFVDNSKSSYFPAIGDQGKLGSCQYWAQIYYQFTYTMNKELNITTTPENTFSPQWGYNIVASTDEMIGIYYDVYRMMNAQGNVFQTQVPYTQEIKSFHPTEDIWKTSIKYRLKDYQKFEELGEKDKIITSPDDPDLQAIKTSIANGDVLAYSTFAYSWDFHKLKTSPDAPQNYKYNNEEVVHGLLGKDGSHRMTIVGYNDNIWVDINNNNKVDSGEMGAFKVANSWGQGWGNKGFMWVAYDALNEVSCVENAPVCEKRVPIFSEICRIDVLTPSQHLPIYVKYTVNTADRTQTNITLYAEKDGTIYSRQAFSNMYHGEKIAYDGSDYATDATMVTLLSNTTADITSENISNYSLSVSAQDLTNDDKILTVKDIQIVDEKAGKIYKAKNAFPFTLNGEEKTINFTESDLNHAVVYYRGYENPQINYKLNGTDFTNDELTHTTERRGYTHKYVIDLKDKDSVTLYFDDKNGNTDDNNGKYFTATKGLNYFVTENAGTPLSVTLTADFDGIIDVDRGCNYYANVSGGYAPYMYQFTFTHLDSKEQKIEAFDDKDVQAYYFRNEGEYEITLEVKDFSDTIVTHKKIVQVKNIPFSFDKMYTERTSNLVSDTVTLNAISQNERIRYTGKVNNTYNYVVTDPDGIICHKNTVTAFDYSLAKRFTHSKDSFVPYKSGTYTATVSSTDNNKEYAEMSVTFEVFDKRYGDSNSDGEISVMDATNIQRMLAGNITQDNVNIELADCDANTEIDVLDATLIQRYIAKLSGTKNTGVILEYIPPVEETPEPTLEPTPTPTDPPVTKNVVTFTNSFGWGGTISCYYWSDTNMNMTSWPGMKMTLVGTNDFGESMYSFKVPQGASYIIFTNGSNQTTDIPYSGGETRYYPLQSTDSKGHNLVNTW